MTRIAWLKSTAMLVITIVILVMAGNRRSRMAGSLEAQVNMRQDELRRAKVQTDAYINAPSDVYSTVRSMRDGTF